jgi:two-component system cell cycle sensor histidine kinase/response regulator CckA
LTRPSLQDILDACAKASFGDLSVRVPVDPNGRDDDPLVTLGYALNILLGDLEERTRTLADSEARFRTAFDRAKVGMVMTAGDGRLIEVNPAFAEMLGYDPDELVGQPFADITHPDDRGPSLAVFKEVIAGGLDKVDLEKRYLRKDGSTLWAQITSAPVRDPDGRVLHFITIIQDVTARREAEQGLRASEQRYRLLFERNPQPIFLFDLETLRFLAVNQAAVQHYGYSRDEFMAMTILDIRPQEDRGRLGDALSTAGTDFRRFGLWRHVRKDGSIIEVDISSHEATFDGRRVRIVLITDVTERLKAERELEAARRQISRSEKLSALGSLVSGVAHEVRTPLAYIQNNASLIDIKLHAAANERDARLAAEVLPLVKELCHGIDRVNDLVRDLRRFTQLQAGDRAVVPLVEPVREAVNLFRATNRGKYDIEVVLEPTPTVHVDSSEVQQVVLNLLQNGAEAMPSGGLLRVTTRTSAAGAELTVADGGPGIPPDVLARMYEPLFTTKPDGTGLGLSIVKRILQAHDATVECRTGIGNGTTFVVTFPRAEER